MATKIERKCPDCLYEFMGRTDKGTGKCRNCEGSGEAPDPMDSFTEAATFGLTKADNICKICSGTRQCQTCGGTGYVYSYENDSVSTSQTSSSSVGGIQGLFISIFGIEKGILYYRIGFLAIFGAVVYFLFTVAIPLIVINIATISLLLGLAKKGKNKFLFTLSILGMLFLILDYNKGWLTITLPSNAPTFKGAIPFFFYLNIAAGLVAAYFLIRDYLNEKNAPAEGESEFSKRNLIVMGSLVLLGGLTIGGQKYFDNSVSREIPLIGYSVPNAPVKVQPTTDAEERNRTMQNAMAQSELAEASTGVVQTKQGSNLRLRSKPSEQAPVVGSIPNGTTVVILGYSDQFEEVNGEKGKWCNISFNGDVGWAWGGFIKSNLNNSTSTNIPPEKEIESNPHENEVLANKKSNFLLTNSRGAYKFNSTGINIKVSKIETNPDYFKIYFEIGAAGENKDLLIYTHSAYEGYRGIVDDRLYVTDDIGNKYTAINGLEGGIQERFNDSDTQINLNPNETVVVSAKFSPIKEGATKINFFSPVQTGHQGGWQFTGISLKNASIDK